MSQNKPYRISRSTLDDDKTIYMALKGIKSYQPNNSTHSIDEIDKAFQEMNNKQEQEVQALAAASAAKNDATNSEWYFHNLIQGAKDQVIAQFGEDSEEVKSVGLKKRSDYKRGNRKPKTTP